MGLILSRYGKKKTPVEVLEGIEEEIQSIEDTRQITLQRQKKIVGHLIIYSVAIYVIAALLFYFCFFPASLKDRLFYIIPLFIFPVIVVFLKKLVTWHYKREIVRSKDRLIELRSKKKKILDEVMDKETFKVAKEILEKFAPDQLRKNLPMVPVPEGPKESGVPKKETQRKTPEPQLVAVVRSGPGGQVLEAPNRSPPVLPVPGPPMQQRRLIRPVLPQNRSLMDRLIETLVGDGPNNRYALICKNCATHNGMAFKEEFEYIAFRCVYCGFPNPSRKSKTSVSAPTSGVYTRTDEQESQSEEEIPQSSRVEDTADSRSQENQENEINVNNEANTDAPAEQEGDSSGDHNEQNVDHASETKKDQ